MRSAGLSDGVSSGVTEKTPVMRDSGVDLEGGSDPRSPRGEKERPRDILKRKAKEKIKDEQKYERRFSCIIFCCGIIVLIGLVAIFYAFYNYYHETIEERGRRDNKPTVVSEQWIDYLAPDVVAPEWPYNIMRDQVNCTNLHPCQNWDCQYVREHFHKKPDECEYQDHMTLITILILICALCTTCSLIKENC